MEYFPSPRRYPDINLQRLPDNHNTPYTLNSMITKGSMSQKSYEDLHSGQTLAAEKSHFVLRLRLAQAYPRTTMSIFKISPQSKTLHFLSLGLSIHTTFYFC